MSRRVTVWVKGETEDERKERIVHFVDDFVSFGVRELKYFECELKDKEGYPVGSWLREDCDQLEEAYPGLTAWPFGSILNSIGDEVLNTGRFRLSNGNWSGFTLPPTLGHFYYVENLPGRERLV
ncbi:MAG: hypothetical protein F4077_05515 [Gammaproteobacteria bacterium]|nr:hypothetical protein [Gammaproteobacteria bacterium]MYI77206.1 hypothetical protein [Gammaproteobacteria bacterium]